MTNEGVFITGGAGFIGRWVAARCLEAGLRVTLYDNLSVGRRDNIAEFGERVTLIEGDINDVSALRAAMQTSRSRKVFHLAAHHFIPYCNAHPLETLRVNVEGTMAVFQTAAECGIETIVAASSGVLYAAREEPLHESEAPVVIDVYGLSKRMTEEIGELFAQTTPLRCILARLFNTYGPYETNPHLIPHIMECLHTGPRLELGNLHPKRDYIYVEDTANLLYQCAGISDKHAVVNIGTGTEYSVSEMIILLSELLDKPIEVVIDPARARPVDKPHQIADIARLRRLTGCSPAYSLRTGLEKLLAHEGLLSSDCGA